MATSSIPIFNGTSSYSADFQQVLSRAVSIASLPMQTLQNSESTLEGQQSELGILQNAFTTLQNDITAVNSATQGSPAAQSSQPSAVQATTSAGALPGTYSIEVDDIGSASTTLSQAGSPPVTDPTTESINSAPECELSVNDSSYSITPSGSSLEDLVSAINTSGAPVQATIVNVGSNTSPDYRLAVTSTNLGSDTIQLSAGDTNLLSTLTTGTPAKYKLNGSTNAISGTSDQVTLSPGLTVNLLQQTQSGKPATVTVTNSYSGLSNALSNLASDYNSAVSALSQNVGQNGGALAGLSIVYELQGVLQNLANYSSGSGSVSSLNDIGLSLDQNGNLSFDPSALSSANITSVQQFLGNTGSGFIQSATSLLSSAADTTNGMITSENKTDEDEITNLGSQISQDQSRIDDMTTSLQSQLSAADAAIATLESQKTYFTDLFDATYLNNGTSNG